MRISFRNRNLGYPLLAPGLSDYLAGGFDIAAPDARRNSGGISLQIAYRLESPYLNGLVEQGRAAFQSLIVGDGSFMREATPHTQQPVQQHTLDLARWSGTIEVMPYLTATQRIVGFTSDEHHPEFAAVEPDGFTIEPAMILAVGNAYDVDIDETASASAVVDIQPRTRVAPGEFQIDLEQPHIIVYVAPRDFKLINRTVVDSRDSRRQTLWPSIYLLALSEGIRQLPEHEDHAWSAAFRRALDKSGIDYTDGETLRNDALQYAQRIIHDEKKSYPLGMMLDAFAADDNDPQDGDSDE